MSPSTPKPPPARRLRCVLDTDTFNEVDDQFALAWMLRRPDRFDLHAVTAAPFLNAKVATPAEGMRLSAGEARRVMALCGRDDVPVVDGSERFSGSGEPVDSPAARRILELSEEPGESPLHVVALAALTNVASALWMDPTLADRIVLHWLGGQSPPLPLTHEFNFGQDVPSGDAAFAAFPLVWSPCRNVASHLLTTVPELEHDFEPGGALAAFLTDRVRADVTPTRTDAPAPATAKEIRDLAPVAWLLGGEAMVQTAEAANPLGGNPVRAAVSLDRNAIFSTLFRDLSG